MVGKGAANLITFWLINPLYSLKYKIPLKHFSDRNDEAALQGWIKLVSALRRKIALKQLSDYLSYKKQNEKQLKGNQKNTRRLTQDDNTRIVA